jgi:hypothetical protein
MKNVSSTSIGAGSGSSDHTGRFSAKVRYSADPDACWEFTGAKTRDGYGRFRVGGKIHLAHRVAYRLAYGEIPPGLTVDHLCGHPSCVRYEHLEAVTLQENLRRATERRTHCRAGHEYSDANTYRWRGRRNCRECNRRAVRRYQRRKRETRRQRKCISESSADRAQW